MDKANQQRIDAEVRSKAKKEEEDAKQAAAKATDERRRMLAAARQGLPPSGKELPDASRPSSTAC